MTDTWTQLEHRRFARRMLIGYLVLATGVVAGLYGTYVQSRNGADARIALCAIKHDSETRSAAGHRFLREHPRGIPGIPASVIRASVSDQDKTVNALRFLNCEN